MKTQLKFQAIVRKLDRPDPSGALDDIALFNEDGSPFEPTTGVSGPSLPAGGATGQVIRKRSPANGDAIWGETAQSPPRARTGPFAGKIPVSPRFPGLSGNRSNGTDTGCNAVSVHKAATDISNMSLLFCNWDDTVSNKDQGPGNAVNYTARVEYPAGTYTTVAFGGVSSVATPCVLANGATILSDPVSFAEFIPKDAKFWVHVFVTVATGGKWCQPLLANANGFSQPAGFASPWITGEGSARGTGQADATGTTIGSLAGSWMPGPFAILSDGYLAPRSVLVVGDSIVHGTITTRNVQQNFLSVALADRAGIVVMARSGGATAELSAAGSVAISRLPLMGLAVSMVCEYGCNDFNTGVSLSQLQINLVRIWKLGATRGARCFQTTIMPWTTSSDGWTSLAGQTKNAWNDSRVALNAWLRAGAPIDPISSAPVAIGTAGALLMGQSGHPLIGIIDAADGMESSRDSGLFKVPGITGTATVTNTSPTLTNVVGNFPNGIKIVGAGIPLNTTVISGGGTSTLTLSAPATADGAAVAVAGAYTGDGVHPTAEADKVIAASIDVTRLLAV